MIATPAVWGAGRGPKDYIAALLSDAAKDGTAHLAGAITCHEIVHCLGLNHRHIGGTDGYDDDVKTSGTVPKSMLDANDQNVVWPYATGTVADLDLLQAIAVSGCELAE